jgi:predicted HicB family RNase H-like nuclease
MTAKKKGRPPLPPGVGRKYATMLRLVQADRAAVEQAAKTEGVSMQEWVRQAVRMRLDLNARSG